ncbi:MAG TPA: outer membrane beta-barrel protein [Bdellovibrionota bacterium]|jgi:opacity protein-like surface antigen
MRGSSFFILSIIIAILFSMGAVAEEVVGRTADGCSYKIINGQYMTSCASKDAAPAAPAAADQVKTVTAAPVTSYDSVPVRHNPTMSAPQMPPQQPVYSSIERSEKTDASLDEYEEVHRSRLHSKVLDQTYAGLMVGASNVKETNTGSAMGLGLDIGTNIDDTFGVEIGYSYSKQSLTMGLASRGGAPAPEPMPSYPGSNTLASDASLSSHLFTGEMQAHLTDPLKRLRPYLGAGLGWRSATLSENSSGAGDPNYGGIAQDGGKLRQSSFGGLASAGAKLRVTKPLQIGLAFRYFFPFASQEARLEQPGMSNNNPYGPGNSTRLSSADDTITSSSQYQILGGVQYSF